MQNFSRASLIILFAALVSTVTAASPTGVVREASGGIATIEMTGDVVPSVGDKAEIFFQLAGTDTEVAVATGHVQEVAANKITVKIDSATGTVEADQLARFTANTSATAAVTPAPPVSTAAPSPPPIDSGGNTSGLLPPSTETPTPQFRPPPSPQTETPKFQPPPSTETATPKFVPPPSTKSSPPPSKKLQTPPPKAPRQPPPQRSEPDEALPDARYAAVAYSPSTGRSGWGGNYSSKNEAIARAVRECGANDAVSNWCRNAWIALAISDKRPGGWGSAWGATKAAARAAAQHECKKRNGDARVILCVSAWGDQ